MIRLAILATLAAVSLTACGAAQTDQQYQAGAGVNVRSGPVQLYNALAVDNGDDTATVSVSILNRTDKSIRLISASGRLSNGAKVTTTVNPVFIPADQATQTGQAGSVIVKASKLSPGQYVKLALHFSGGNKAVVDAPVVDRTDIYDKVATGPGGETATPTPATHASGKAAVTAGSAPARQ